MVIQERRLFPSKIKRYDENTNIHNIYIFNKAGICFYCKNFTDHYKIEKNLLSPFITALMSFSEEMMGKRIKTIEMDDIKLVIFAKNSIFYSVLSDSIENLNFLDEIISRINNKIIAYIKKNKIKIDGEIIYDSKINKEIDYYINEIISDEFDLEKEESIKEFLNKLTLRDDIDGIIFSTHRGKVLYSTFNKSDLSKFLKEVDFRVKIYNNSILRLFYTFKDKKYIFSEYIHDKYFIILVFDSMVKFGVAEYLLTKIVKSITKILSK
ncbi:MAG: hypothetical protein ACFFB0_17690 [Promethearchaeota archaeon]